MLQPPSLVELAVFKVILYALYTIGLAALGIECAKAMRRAYRRRLVREELRRSSVHPVPPPSTLVDGRPGGTRVSVSTLRSTDVSHPGAARVLAFHERLATRGRYVDELLIDRRLN